MYLSLFIARAVALTLASFIILNITGSHFTPGFDANVWFVDLRFLSVTVAKTFLFISAVVMLGFAAGLVTHRAAQASAAIVVMLLMAAGCLNVVSFYRIWAAGGMRPGIPVPFSLLFVLVMTFVCRQILVPAQTVDRRRIFVMGITVAACTLLFPLAQMFAFGKTDYRRPADAIVVFGAKTYADGTLSQALFDRTQTAIELYQQGLAPLLIFSGGPGDGTISEPQAMKNLAISKGVSPSAIILDEQGLTTDRTVDNTVGIFESRGINRVLAVSHYYHLPRVKMTYDRAIAGTLCQVEILTVPAEQTQPLPGMPWFITREVAGLWVYYLRPLIR